jgi:hypothetical protein
MQKRAMFTTGYSVDLEGCAHVWSEILMSIQQRYAFGMRFCLHPFPFFKRWLTYLFKMCVDEAILLLTFYARQTPEAPSQFLLLGISSENLLAMANTTMNGYG